MKSSPHPLPERSCTWLPDPKWPQLCRDGWCAPLSPSFAATGGPQPSKFRAHTNVDQLSKEDEAAGEEVEVRREDQDKINKFSRLSSREQVLEEELKAKAVRVPSHSRLSPFSPHTALPC